MKPIRNDLLLLQYNELGSHSQLFFEKLRNSSMDQAAFISNPAGVLAKEVFGSKVQLSEASVSRANQIIFALLSNPGFKKWTIEYQRRIYEEIRHSGLHRDPAEAKKAIFAILGKRRVMHDFAHGMKEWGDDALLRALLMPTGSDRFEPVDPTAILITSLGIFVQIAIFVDQAVAYHVNAVTEQRADAHAVSHADVFLVNDHVLFTTHDFFFDHGSDAAGSDATGSDAAGSDAAGSDAAGSDAAGSDAAGSDAAGSDAAGSDAAGSDATGSDATGSDATGSDATGSDATGSDSGSEAAGSEADTSGFGALFGMSRVDVEVFAQFMAKQMERYAVELRNRGALDAGSEVAAVNISRQRGAE